VKRSEIGWYDNMASNRRKWTKLGSILMLVHLQSRCFMIEMKCAETERRFGDSDSLICDY